MSTGFSAEGARREKNMSFRKLHNSILLCCCMVVFGCDQESAGVHGEACLPGVCANDNMVCENSDVACGESCRNCLTITNVQDAVCEDGICRIRTCQEDYHLEFDDVANTYACSKNTIERCAPNHAGENVVVENCTEIAHSTEVACSSGGQCIVKNCEDGFYPTLDSTQCIEQVCVGCDEATEICFEGTCRCKPGWVSCSEDGRNCKDIINDSDNCGGCGIVCQSDDLIEHAVGFGCNLAQCGVTECESFYHPSGMECELNTSDNCGEHGKSCSGIEHALEATCNEESGICTIVSCDLHYHIDQENETCEEDTADNCNEHGHSCWVEHAAGVECAWDEAGAYAYCVTQECEDGYHLVDNPENPSGPKNCAKDSGEDCGSEGLQCPENASCEQKEDGTYGCKCDDGYIDCDGVCVNLDSNKNHCGTCHNQCKDNQACIGGVCGCASGTDCANSCVDLYNDKNNCGSCANQCKDYQACISGSCGCTNGTDCGSSCVELQSDNNNCGACGLVCKSYQTCKAGKCSCTSGTDCGSSCVDLQNDKNNCGSCGTKCKDYQACISGKCSCTSGTDCGSSCVNLNSDNKNCGACGLVCKSYQTCKGGKCICTSGTDCGSSCVDLQNDKNNCGSCGNKCKDYQACISGKCGCASGTDCGSSCVNVQSDNKNCGACGKSCGSGLACSAGKCVCTGGLTLCGSTCVKVSSDNNHCGACNNKCTNGRACQAGSCICPSGTLYCGSQCVSDVIQGTPMVENNLTVRAAPDVSSAQVGTIQLGTRIHIFGYSNSSPSWYRVANGYVNANYVDLCEGWGTVNTQKDPLMVWQAASSSVVVAKIPVGQNNVCLHSKFTSNGEEWYFLTWGKKRGYARAKYMIENDPIGTIPPVNYCQ